MYRLVHSFLVALLQLQEALCQLRLRDKREGEGAETRLILGLCWARIEVLHIKTIFQKPYCPNPESATVRSVHPHGLFSWHRCTFADCLSTTVLAQRRNPRLHVVDVKPQA